MATAANPQRVTWVVTMLDPAPDEEILEIGSGAGTAIEHICRRLTNGRITGIDRSANAVRRATRRNAEAIAAGKARLRCVSLADLDLPGQTFTTIFAVNVSLFWAGDCTAELAVVGRLLAAGSALHLFHHSSEPDRVRQIARATTTTLHRHGLRTRVAWSAAGTLSLVTARRVDGLGDAALTPG